jgi:hypothetical protein
MSRGRSEAHPPPKVRHERRSNGRIILFMLASFAPSSSFIDCNQKRFWRDPERRLQFSGLFPARCGSMFSEYSQSQRRGGTKSSTRPLSSSGCLYLLSHSYLSWRQCSLVNKKPSPFAICDGCHKRRRVHRWRGRLDLCADCTTIRVSEERRAEGSAVKRRTDSVKRAHVPHAEA